MGRKTLIDWADASWNPVTGCYHDCKYCYARRIAERFNGHVDAKAASLLLTPPIHGGGMEKTENLMQFSLELDKPIRNTDTYEYMRIAGISAGKILPYPFGFTPTFHKYRLDEPARWTKPRTIFVCSMADLFGNWVNDEWITEVFDACRKAPQHRYLFLTKNPKRYDELKNKGIITGKEENFWLGSTMTGPANPFYSSGFDKTFISIEPILRPFSYAGNAPFAVSWVIVGAETGNRKDKVVPKKEWILEIAEKCRALDTPIFMKESLRGIMGEDFVQEFPWEAV